jgi:signal transduction histidine kinase
VSRSAEALWRAIAVFRFASLGYAALLLAVINRGNYSRPDWAWVAIAAMTAWTVFTTIRYNHREGRTARLLTADLLVTLGFLMSNIALQYAAAQRNGLEPVTATWVAGPVLVWAVRYGRVAGAAVALVMSAGDFALRSWTFPIVPNGEVLMLLAGVAVGHLAQLADALEAERQHADRVEAASRERERLARDIHDSVLQVLALVHRRGLEAGGEAAELGRLAGEQEAALRALVADDPMADGGHADLTSMLQPLATDGVTLAAPAGVVSIKRDVGEGVAAAVRAALDNVRQHCGEQARAWVLVEDEPDMVTVTIRDDGPGIPEGRLAEAEAAGRLGVSQSICGRLRALGGSASVSSVLGEGTEVTLRLPRPVAAALRPRRPVRSDQPAPTPAPAFPPPQPASPLGCERGNSGHGGR